MKKIAVLLLCILVILALPFGIGLITEQRSEAITEHYRSNPSIHAFESQFKRGWFHSEISSTASLFLPDISADNINVIVHQSVRHGPILWGDHRPLAFGFADMKIDIELPTDIQRKITQTIGNMPKISLLSQLHYDGSQDSILFIPEFSHAKDDVKLTMHPLTLRMHSNLNMDQVHGSWDWHGMQFEALKAGEKVHLTLGKSTLTFDLQKSGALWTGNTNVQADTLDIIGKAHQLKFQRLNLDGQTSIDNKKRVSSVLGMHFEQLNKDGIIYSLGNSKFSLKQIPLSFYEKIQKLQAQVAKLPPEQRQQALQNMGFSLFSVLPDILTSEPIIELSEVSLNTPDGNIHGALHLSLLGLDKQDMMNFIKIKRHIRADLQVNFPSALLSKSDIAKAQDFIDKGWLIKENNMLHGTLHMADGILTINKQTISLPF